MFLVPLCCMFFLSYLTYWNITDNTDLFGYYAYQEFFMLWRALKPLFLFLVLAKIFFLSSYSVYQKVFVAVFLVTIFFLCRLFHPNFFLLYALSFCFAARDVSYKKIAKTYFIMATSTFLLTFVALAYGIIEDYSFRRGASIRHSFGLVHPNSLGMWSLLILVYFVQYKQNQIKLLHLALLCAQSVCVYYLTNSRASFILSIFVLFSTFIFSRINSKKLLRLIAVFFVVVILSLAIMWLLLCFGYKSDDRFYSILDKLFSGRLHLSKQALEEAPLSIMGNNITFNYYVDPLFTYTIVVYGIVGLSLFLSMFYFGAIRSYKAGLYYILIPLAAFQFYNTQENVFLYHLFDLTMFTATCHLEDQPLYRETIEASV